MMQKDFDFPNDTSLSNSLITSSSSILLRPVNMNNIKQRLVALSPTVKAGLERECCKEDFTHELEDSELIGKGAYGEVFKVTHKITGKVYAIKVLDKKQILEKKNVNLINREIEIMYKLNHPHVMNLTNYFEDDSKIYLIMPYAIKGQLYKLLKRQGRFDERTTSQYVLETIEAVSYLHSFNPKIVHRDIKPENLLFDENMRIKLTDFGIATYLNEGERLHTLCGSNEYMAPEVLKGQPYDEACDIWAIGVLFFELLTGYTPFKGNDTNELISNIKKLKINWPNDFPPLAKNLVSKILKLDPKERLSLEEIRNHAWFNQNCPFRPMLKVKTMDSEETLQSHLINPSRNDISSYIKTSLNMSSIGGLASPNKVLHNSPSNISLTDNSSILSNFNEKISEISELNSKLINARNEISQLKRDNEIKDDTIETLRKQVDELTVSLENKITQLKNKDILINELDTKIADKEKELTQFKEEKQNTTLELFTLNSKITSYQKEKESQSKEISQLYDTIATITKMRDDFKEQYESERLINKNLQESKNKTNQTSNLSTKSLIEILTNSLRETKQFLSTKIEKIESNLYEIKTNKKQSSELLRETMINQMAMFNDLLYKYKNSLLQSIEDTMANVSKSQLEKKEEIIKYLSDKNKELLEQITLLKNENNEMKCVKTELDAYKEKYKDLKREYELNNKMVSLYTEKSKRNEKRFLDLKYQVQNMKDYAAEILESNGKIEEIIKLINEL